MIKNIIILFLIFSSILFAITDKELGISIDLAGKQRMLTQKMAKETLLILMDSQKKQNIKNLSEDIKLFDKTLKGLIAGDEELGLVPVEDDNIQNQLQKVMELWNPFKKAAKKIVEGNASPDDYNMIVLNNNLKLLEEMNKAVYMYASLAKKEENQTLKMANNINLAGKQRMLTQKMAKDLLIASLASPKDRKPYEKDFQESRELFSKTINGLINGDSDLNLQKTLLPDIKNQLVVAKKIWDRKQKLFDKSLKTKDKNKVVDAISTLDKLKVEMDRAVKLYTKSINKQKQKKKLSNIVKEYIDNKNIMRKLVNLSGKQRMLTQKLTKLTIECVLHINNNASCEKINSSVKEYERAIVTFVKGNKNRGLPPTEDKKALLQIKKIISLWKPFAISLKKIAQTQGKDKNALVNILKSEQKLLKESDKLVKIYESGDSDQDYLQKARLHIVNIAGRERMLTQKMTKEKLLWLKLSSQKQKEKMQETMKLFEESLNSLLHGNKKKNLPKATNPKIVAQLKKVEEIWQKIKPLYLKEKLSKEELELLVKVNPILLKEMNKAVDLMEKEVEY
jgi:hypothetical protein